MSDLTLLTTIYRAIDKTKAFSLNYDDQEKEIASLNENQIYTFRIELRNIIISLQAGVTEKYNPKISRYILIPILSFIDETIYQKIDKSVFPIKWQSFQHEFFEIDNGGNVTYDICDEVLDNPIYPYLCYQVYFIIFREGYQGKFYTMPSHNQRQLYQNRIDQHLFSKSPDHGDLEFVSTYQLPTITSNRIWLTRSLIGLSMLLVPLSIYLISIIWIIK